VRPAPIRQLISLLLLMNGVLAPAVLAQDAPIPVPKITGPIPATSDSYPFLGAGHTVNPIDFAKAGYVEE
jgi:hypothetical protein